MDEGEKQGKKIYKRGDVVTFRLLKKFRHIDDVVDLLNAANIKDELNKEIIEAIELYAKYKNFRNTVNATNINEYEADFFKIMNQSHINNSELDNNEVINNAEEELSLDLKSTQIEECLNNIEKNEPDVLIQEIVEENEDGKVINVPVWGQEDKAIEEAANEIFNIGPSKDKQLEQTRGNGMAKAFKSLRRG